MKTDNSNRLQILILPWVLLVLLLCGYGAEANSENDDVDGATIDSVFIQNGDIFDLDLPENKLWLFKLANELHINTKKHVIGRELLIRKGSIFSRKLADESERNLRSLPILFDARIEFVKTAAGLNLMQVTTSDRWTLAGGPTISRKSGQTIYQFGFEELNFLGYGQRISFDYFIREFEENYVQTSFYERRLFGSRFGVNSYYNGDPEVGIFGFDLTRPLFSLNSKIGYSISYKDIDRIDKYYSSGDEFARNNYVSKQFSLSAVYRFGDYHNKVSIGFAYSYKDIKISDRLILPIYLNSFHFPIDSAYSNYAISLEASNLNYIKATRINRMNIPEDISLGISAGISSGYAIDAGTNGRLYRTMSFSGRLANQFGPNLIFFNFHRVYWYYGGIDYRKTTNLSIRCYNRTISWLTPFVLAIYSEDWRRDGQEVLYLGENNGVRGYPRYNSEGDKLLRLNIENRFFTGVKLVSAEIGITQFFDFGQTWSDGELFDLKQTLWTVGCGIRFGTERVSNAEMIRIDLSYAGKIKNWQISFGVGQYL